MDDVTLTLGTKEYLVLDITDELGNIETLDGSSPEFRITDDSGTEKVAWASAVNEVMRLFCLLDTSTWTQDDDVAVYNVYARFTDLPEVPVIGPFPFNVNK